MEGCTQSTMVKEFIRKEIDTCLNSWFASYAVGSVPRYAIEEPPKEIGADLSINLAMLLAKFLKKAPKTVASGIAEQLRRHANKKIISDISIAGPGFINIRLGMDMLYDAVREAGRAPEIDEAHKKEKILIEFVSANPTGPLHIGHGRGAALGDSLARILHFSGYLVDTEYYVNNIGNQIEMLGNSVMARLKQLQGEKSDLPADGYQGEYILDIAKKLHNEKKECNSTSVQEYAIADILHTIQDDLKNFGIVFKHWFYESELYKQNLVEKTIERFIETKHVYKHEGAYWFKSTAYGDEKDRVVKRADGRFTYLASDIAYHAGKLERGYKKLIDIWGADHHGYVKRVKAAIEALGSSPDQLKIILYQLVNLSRSGKPVPMSTRAGRFVMLREVLDEVGRDGCRFFFAMRSPQSQLEFDLELAKKKSQENPVYYVQYVHARICSIFREAEKNKIKPATNIIWSRLSSPEERMLMKKIAFFPDTVLLCIDEMSPHHLTRYLLDLASLFHKFYDTCRVLTEDKELTSARLTLIEAVKKVIATGLDLLGVSAPQRM